MPRRILIVDNDELPREILWKLLQPHYTLALAGSGQEAIAVMRDFAPDLVLLDLVMPDLDGYEVCRRIKQSPDGELTQVIFVSGHGETEHRLKGYEVGADDYVVKPFDGDELLAKIRVQVRLRDAMMGMAVMKAELEIHNARLEDLVLQRTAAIVETQDVAVFALAKLAESRDHETGEHLERIRHVCRLLAERLRADSSYAGVIDSRFVSDLHRASPLHDIGKVGIPDAILLKPGKLTDAEFRIMKTHTIIGANALESARRHAPSGTFLGMAAEIARSHHERFDGSGYPAGLRGEDIPLSARIVGLADVYDALTHQRVYKPAYPPEVAKAMIEAETGKHFDPVVARAFVDCFDELNRRHKGVSMTNLELART
ncbi:MAG: HD domain-containing phosphohydrolase [Planctomycetota bacterium]